MRHHHRPAGFSTAEVVIALAVVLLGCVVLYHWRHARPPEQITVPYVADGDAPATDSAPAASEAVDAKSGAAASTVYTNQIEAEPPHGPRPWFRGGAQRLDPYWFNRLYDPAATVATPVFPGVPEPASSPATTAPGDHTAPTT